MATPNQARQIEKLTSGDKERMEQERAELKDQMTAINRGETSTARDAIDSSIVQKNLNRTEEMLARDEALIAKGRDKDKLQREAKALEEELRQNMISHNEAWPTRMGTIEAERAIQKQMRFETQYGEKARRWQNIQRRLEPNDPDAGNLDRIRPSR